MKKILLSLNCLFWLSWSAMAQESNVAQYYHAPFLTNPGMIGAFDQTSLIVNHRSQTVDAGKTYATSTASGFYPIAIGNHRLGVGASFLSDRVADYMSTNGGLLGTAYSIRLSRLHELSLGAQAGFFNRKLNSSFQFTTDSQFIDGSFNGDAPTGEVFIEQSRNYMTLSTGLFWQMKDREGRQKAYAGGAIFNFNEPNVGFDQVSSLPISLKATAGYEVLQNGRFSVMPNFRWIYQSNFQLLNAGTWLGYNLSQSVEYLEQMRLGAWYGNNNTGTLALEYAKSNYLVGVCYDVPMLADLNTLQKGGIFEVALSFKIGKKKQTVVKDYSPTATEPAPAPQVVEEKPAVPVSPSEDIIKPTKVAPLKGSQMSEVKPKIPVNNQKPQLVERDKLVLDRTVDFDFRTDELTGDAREFLDMVAGVMKRNTWLKVTLIGHTCNIGTEADNQQLSVRRAEEVQSYLMKQGIDQSRVIVQGQGESKPIADNSTEMGRAKNRRVEFEMIDQ